jgi:hypothetical protein
MFGHMHGVLNVDKKTNCTVLGEITRRGESFNDFPFGDVMNLSTQLTKPSIIVPKTFASFLLESF